MIEYKEGELLTVYKFAFIPLKVQGKWIWLKKYSAKYVYTYKYINVCEGFGKFEECVPIKSHLEFKLIERKLIK